MFLAILLAAAGPVCDATWHDAARNRDIPVRIRMPADNGKAPLILFSHGLGGSVEAGSIWAKAWADAGFLVVHLQHPGSDGPATRANGLRASMGAEQLLARVGDVRFALDTVTTGPKTGSCDLARGDMTHVGMAGHSFGSHTTLAVAGQSFRAAGAAELADRRITAAIAFSPAPPMRAGLTDADAFGSIAIPLLSLTGSEDSVPITPVTAQDRQRPFRAMSGGKYLLWLDGANHAAFSGGGGRPIHGSAPDAHVQPIVIRATTLFWRWTLLGEGAARTELDAMARMLGPRDRLERR
jgi:predicted dienelactone hydrolase